MDGYSTLVASRAGPDIAKAETFLKVVSAYETTTTTTTPGDQRVNCEHSSPLLGSVPQRLQNGVDKRGQRDSQQEKPKTDTKPWKVGKGGCVAAE